MGNQNPKGTAGNPKKHFELTTNSCKICFFQLGDATGNARVEMVAGGAMLIYNKAGLENPYSSQLINERLSIHSKCYGLFTDAIKNADFAAMLGRVLEFTAADKSLAHKLANVLSNKEGKVSVADIKERVVVITPTTVEDLRALFSKN